MNAPLDPDKITRLLNIDIGQLDQQALSRLKSARHAALNKHSTHASFFGAGLQRWSFDVFPRGAQRWAFAALLLIVVSGVAGYWDHAQEQQLSELDVAILTDELPIEVFLD